MAEDETPRTQEEMEKDLIARASRFRGYYSGYSKGWMLGHEERDGVEMEVLVWIYNWFDEEKEEMGRKA
jgi:hypothetical protein